MIRILVLIVLLLLISAVSLKFLPLPFIWIGLTFALVTWCGVAFSPERYKFLIVIAGSVPLAIAVAECYFAVSGRPQIDHNRASLYEEDPLLGWRLRSSQVTDVSASAGDHLIYDVVYSIDADGRRVSPADLGEKIEACVIFFSDSFTFGEGVNDDEAFPYQVGVKSGGKARIVNLAVPGYGAAQMLAMIDVGDLKAVLGCKPTHIWYAALPHHVQRASGIAKPIQKGPLYELLASGDVKYAFTHIPRRSKKIDANAGIGERILAQLLKSKIYQTILNVPAAGTDEEIELYMAIVRKSFQLFSSEWPDAKRFIIGWDIHSYFAQDSVRFIAGLAQANAEVYSIDTILPGYSDDPIKYGLHKYDLHPNAQAHDQVASFICIKTVSAKNCAQSD